MASQSIKTLGKFIRPNVLEQGLPALLPEAYKKFYKEWKFTQPTAVHYIPEEGRWKRDEVTGEVSPIQNIPLPTIFPKEAHRHIWGGEEIIQGFTQKKEDVRRNPHFWVPVLKRSVVYSEVLDKHISVIVTDRAVRLIHTHYGFDHYLLKTPACDLKSLLAVSLKRKILQELEQGCPTYAERPEKQKEITKKYGEYLSTYTSEEIKWYGYSLSQAIKIFKDQLEQEHKAKIVPLKHVFRTQLVEKLKAASDAETAELGESVSASWLQRINPFGKKHET